MTRNATAAFKAQNEALTGARPIILAFFDFDNDPLRIFTGGGDLSWGGETWIGTGSLVEFSAPVESADLRANNLEVTLNDADIINQNNFIQLALAEPMQARTFRLWIGFLADDGTVVADPLLLFEGFMDRPSFVYGQAASITIHCEQDFINQRRQSLFRMTDAEHRSRHANDNFFAHVHEMRTKVIEFPTASGSAR